MSEPPASVLSRLDPGPMPRVPRRLTAVECRVLGALLEKQQAVPDSYPMTLQALVAACNQKTNRDPVMELAEIEVAEALKSLLRDVLVWRREGARALRWEHSVDKRWRIDPAGKAVTTLLLLRGPQTPGELRGRAERLHAFGSVGEVEATLLDLAAGDEPMVRQLPREPGQKESRWMHLLGDDSAQQVSSPDAAPRASATGGELESRVAELEARLARLERQLGVTS